MPHLVRLLQKALDGLRHGLHLIQVALNDLVLRASAHRTVHKDARDHVEEAYDTEGDVEVEDDEVKLASTSEKRQRIFEKSFEKSFKE